MAYGWYLDGLITEQEMYAFERLSKIWVFYWRDLNR
jgi:hypothetical protein